MRSASRIAHASPVPAQTIDGLDGATASASGQVRLGYFANVTHAQAVLGTANGDFRRAVLPARFSTKVFSAGPSLIEALFAREIDVGYVGPGPVISAFARSKGRGISVISGSAANGVLIVARKDAGIRSVHDLTGKRIATPQNGNTQDIAARHFVLDELKQKDSNNVLAIANAEQAGLMLRGEIDVAWTPEPWGSRLIAENGATLVGQEKDLWPDKQFALAVVVTTPEFLARHTDVVNKLLAVHRKWTEVLNSAPPAHAEELEQALFALGGKKLPNGVVRDSLSHVQFTLDPLPGTFDTMARWTYELGFAREPVRLNGLFAR